MWTWFHYNFFHTKSTWVVLIFLFSFVFLVPRLTRVPSNVINRTGDKAYLACEAYGIPTPHISFRKVGSWLYSFYTANMKPLSPNSVHEQELLSRSSLMRTKKKLLKKCLLTAWTWLCKSAAALTSIKFQPGSWYVDIRD